MPLIFMLMPGPLEMIILMSLVFPVIIVVLVLYFVKSNSDTDKFREIKSNSAMNSGTTTNINTPAKAVISQRTPWEEGRAAGEARSIVRLIEYRFKQCPEPACKKIYAVSDFERLEFLFQKAMSCQSLEEFLGSLN